MLIPDFAHKLLQNILHRHNAARAAVLVDDHSHMRLGLLERFEKPADRLVFQHEKRRYDNFRKRLFCDPAADVEILLMDRAENVVDGILIDEKAGVFRLREERRDLFLARRDRKRREVDAVNQDILRLLLGKIDGVL